MSTLTKQWLQQKIADIEATRDEIPFGLDEDDSNTLAALRIALASLEAEPAGWQVKTHGGNWVSINKEDVDHYRFNEDLPVREVYTSPQAPVSVPDEVCWEDVPEEITEDDMALASAWAHGFNQCRAAMLKHSEPFIVTSDHRMMEMPQVEAINAVTAMIQGFVYAETPTTMQTAPALDSSPKIAELPSGNSPVIPDGWVACSERMPKKNDKVLIFIDFNSEYVPPSIHDAEFTGSTFRRGGATVNVFPLEDGYGVTHWQPLPAAPQQEVMTDNTTQQFESLSFVVTSDERKMELPRCSKHPETELLIHPFEQLMSYPPRPVMYCPLCKPEVAEWVERDKQIQNYWKDKK